MNIIHITTIAALALTGAARASITLSFTEDAGTRYLVTTVNERTTFEFNASSGSYGGYGVALVMPGVFTPGTDLGFSIDPSIPRQELQVGGGAGTIPLGESVSNGVFTNAQVEAHIDFDYTNNVYITTGTAELYLNDPTFGYNAVGPGDKVVFEAGTYYTEVHSQIEFVGGAGTVTLSDSQLATMLEFDNEGRQQVAPADITAAVPEPSGALLGGIGLLGLLARRRKA